MSYDKPNRIKYSKTFDAGNNGNEAFYFSGPKGKVGRLWDYGVEGVTEAFTANASVSVGNSGDPNAYGEVLALGALAVDSGTFSVRSQYGEHEAGFATNMVDREIPADTPFCLDVIDDAAAGIADFFVIVDWQD